VRRAAAGVLVALACAGCGSLTVHELPPAAEPPRSPAPKAQAAGELIPVGGAPEGVVVDPRTHVASVAVRDPDALAMVDLRSRRVLRRVALPGAPRHLAQDDDGRTVLVPAETANRFLAVDVPSGRVTERAATGAYPHDLAPLAGGGVAIGDERGDSLTVLRPDAAPRTVRVAAQPGGVTTVDGGRLIAVVSVRERVLELYDARTLRRVARESAGVGPTHVACEADGGWCWVLDTQGDALLVFRVDGDHLELTRRLFLPGGPYGIAVDPGRLRLWVTLPAHNEVVELPAHGRPHVVARHPTVRQPDSVAVDTSTGQAVVTGRTDGLLQLVTP
jgi:DNA-binding beta-propeller fold protein YncE